MPLVSSASYCRSGPACFVRGLPQKRKHPLGRPASNILTWYGWPSISTVFVPICFRGLVVFVRRWNLGFLLRLSPSKNVDQDSA